MLSDIYIQSDTAASLLYVDAPAAFDTPPTVKEATCPFLGVRRLPAGQFRTILDASALQCWSPNHPVLYTLETQEGTIRFGFTDIAPRGNREILLNGSPCYLRGYIRGIVAHEHPNMTGLSLKEAAVKNIRQARKFGFNLVRFHSTIPTPEFVEAADEEGLLLHIEIGFAYQRDEKGNKKNLSADNAAWRETILKYRNHPCIAIFCIGNEMHNSGHYPEVHALYAQGRALAPGKLILDNSGWGEYDRPTADIYSQHIAYFYPYKHHANMFHEDACWRYNGSAYDVTLDTESRLSAGNATAHRTIVPRKPTIAHEAVHYIEIPDYDAMIRKFDDFCAKVGQEYLEKNDIRKPRYMTELPKLIARKGLAGKMPDYIQASRQFKRLAIKQYLEQCRLAGWLCGFEMLQFADCLKYENKNGIVDCFDDDKFLTADWMKQFNGDIALLAQWNNDVHRAGETIHGDFYLSDYLEKPALEGGVLRIFAQHEDGRTESLYEGEHITLAGGLQKVLSLDFQTTPAMPEALTVKAEFTAEGISIRNQWVLWVYPAPALRQRPAILRLARHDALQTLLTRNSTGSELENCVVTDVLDEQLLADLEAGRHVLLLYHGQDAGNTLRLPGTLERFKPCIWDRGNNLGGILYEESLQKALANNRYFAENWYGLLDTAWKINLDHFPVQPTEHIAGVDKPVRDRMKGLVKGSKDFEDDDTLRKFSHLFTLRTGTGTLTVCTLLLDNQENPAVAAFTAWLFNHLEQLNSAVSISLADFRDYLEKETAAPPHHEDVMNHFWEIDNKLVEDTLFWEQAKIDLTKID